MYENRLYLHVSYGYRFTLSTSNVYNNNYLIQIVSNIFCARSDGIFIVLRDGGLRLQEKKNTKRTNNRSTIGTPRTRQSV